MVDHTFTRLTNKQPDTGFLEIVPITIWHRGLVGTITFLDSQGLTFCLHSQSKRRLLNQIPLYNKLFLEQSGLNRLIVFSVIVHLNVVHLNAADSSRKHLVGRFMLKS